MKCPGLHCPGCRHGSGGGGGAIAALLILLAVTAAAKAITRILPALLHLLAVAGITAATTAVIITAAMLAARRPAARPPRRPAHPRLPAKRARAIHPATNRRQLPAPPAAAITPKARGHLHCTRPANGQDRHDIPTRP
jgi:hypothetical protein